MVRLSSLIVTLAGLATAVLAIPHDKVKGFEEEVSSKVLTKWKPWLKVDGGCVPWPAVNREGETGDGLKPTGSPTGKCGGNKGQVYVRAKQLEDKYAIMYAWYFPKNQPVHPISWHGRRHDWQSVVVFLSKNSLDAKLLGISFTRANLEDQVYSIVKAGDWPPIERYLDGTRPKMKFQSDNMQDPFDLVMTTTKGGEQPLIDWQKLTPAARKGLNERDYRDVQVPFKDSIFDENLAKAWP